MNVYDFTVKAQDGSEVSLADYRGKVLLIVNTATGCGFTPQYDDLQDLYDEHQKDGLEILDFPCNQFGEQVLKKTDKDFKNNSSIKWNFTKFLIDREGKIIARFEPMTSLKKVKAKVEEVL